MVIRSAGPRPALIEFISFPRQAADFLIYPWKSIPSACSPNWDKLSVSCSSPVANLSHMLCTVVVARPDCLSSI